MDRCLYVCVVKWDNWIHPWDFLTIVLLSACQQCCMICMSLLCDIYYTHVHTTSIHLFKGPHIKEASPSYLPCLCITHGTDLIYSDHAGGSAWPAINKFLVIGCLYRTQSISSHSVHHWPVWMDTTKGQFGFCSLCISGFIFYKAGKN